VKLSQDNAVGFSPQSSEDVDQFMGDLDGSAEPGRLASAAEVEPPQPSSHHPPAERKVVDGFVRFVDFLAKQRRQSAKRSKLAVAIAKYEAQKIAR
jgi:hypothetical protein